VRVIGDAKERGWWSCRGQTEWTKRVPVPAKLARFVRVEVRSEDGRRAYSNPIYLG
jgi:hypothetical protein